MKKLLFTILLCLLSVVSCENNKLDGDWGDVIKFSQTELSVGKEGGTNVITSKGDWWWILDEFYMGGTEYYLRYNDLFTIVEEGDYNEIVEITGAWFVITKENKQKLVIFVKPNDTGKERNFLLMIEAGDYFTNIKVKQKAE